MPAQTGSPAPDFTLRGTDKKEVSLSSYRGHKTLIVFIPFPFTRVCEGELCAIRDNLHRLEAEDANVVVITCHAPQTNKAWADQNGFTFPILADFWPHGVVAKAYGCFNDVFGVSTRSTYVLDADGIVTEIIAAENQAEGRDFEAYMTNL